MNERTSKPGAEPIYVRVDPELRTLVPSYLDNKRRDLQRLRTALAEGDFLLIEHVGHNIKGTGAGYGFSVMSELGAALEAAAKIKDQQHIAQCLDRIDDFLGRVVPV